MWCIDIIYSYIIILFTPLPPPPPPTTTTTTTANTGENIYYSGTNPINTNVADDTKYDQYEGDLGIWRGVINGKFKGKCSVVIV